MNNSITDIYNLIQELSWYFGSQGFKEECCGDLTLIEFMALKNAHDNNCSGVQEIGIALNISKSGASKVIDRLENKGYILRIQSSTDGRVCCVGVTNKGKEAITQIGDRYTEYVGTALKNFEPDEVDNVKNVLVSLLNSIKEQGFIKSIKTK